MNEVFISYRHIEPDQTLAQFLAKHFREHGCSVFVDAQIEVGMKWAEEIERQIRAAKSFIVLISKDSMVSDMVRQEVKWAHQELSRSPHPIKILPARVAYTGELPYDLGSWLNPIQYTLWEEGEDAHQIAERLLRAVQGLEVLNRVESEADQEASQTDLQELANAVNQGPPLPVADIRLALDTGTVKLSSPFYVRRHADDELENQITQQGETTIVKGPRQMGKSSLLARAHARVKEQGHPSFYLDFQLLDEAKLDSLSQLLPHIANKIARELKTAVKPKDMWDENLGPKDNLTYFIEEAVLAEAEKPVFVFLDEADRVFPYPYRNDFFAMIRGWHNSRATNPVWDKLNLVIAHATDPTAWIEDINQSPFNVGTRLRLDDFTLEHMNDLNTRHGQPLKTASDIQDLLALVGGQPYLVRQAFYSLATNKWTMKDLQKVAGQDRGPFGDHLRRIVSHLLDKEDLKMALKEVLADGRCKEEPQFQRLLAMGLIRGETRHAVTMRCQLYQDYCRQHL